VNVLEVSPSISNEQAFNHTFTFRAARKPPKPEPEQIRGISEQFGDGTIGDQAVTELTAENFEDV
jgi:hypothetical protein